MCNIKRQVEYALAVTSPVEYGPIYLFCFFLFSLFFACFFYLQKLRIDILRLPRNRSEVSTPHLEYLNSIEHGPRKGVP